MLLSTPILTFPRKKLRGKELDGLTFPSDQELRGKEPEGLTFTRKRSQGRNRKRRGHFNLSSTII